MLFDKDQASGEEEGGFKINEDFARKFEHSKRREILDKAKQKYGARALQSYQDEDGEQSSSSSSDDSEAELINERVENKFMQVMAAI